MKYNTDNIINIVTLAYEDLASKQLLDLEKQLSREKFFEEFCIVKLGLPRRSGKTTAAYKLLELFPKSLLINGLSNSSIPFSCNKECKNVISIHEISNDFFRGKHLSLIIIENSSYINPSRLSNLYKNASLETELILELL